MQKCGVSLVLTSNGTTIKHLIFYNINYEALLKNAMFPIINLHINKVYLIPLALLRAGFYGFKEGGQNNYNHVINIL